MWIKNLTGGKLHIPDLGVRMPPGNHWYEVDDSLQGRYGIKQGVALGMIEITFDLAGSKDLEGLEMPVKEVEDFGSLIDLDVALLTTEQALDQFGKSDEVPKTAGASLFDLIEHQPDQVLIELGLLEGEISEIEFKLTVNDLFQHERAHQNRPALLEQLGNILL